jgi:hypothetical protein
LASISVSTTLHPNNHISPRNKVHIHVM